jgi:TonB family protein
MRGSRIGTIAGVKRLGTVLVAIGFFCDAANIAGQSTKVPSSGQTKEGTTQSDSLSLPLGVEILSDTEGVDFGPYMRQAIPMIKASLIRLLPEEARTPANLQGATVIRITISADGKISAMHLDESSNQTKLDRAAWGSITSIGKFPSLPKEFRGPNLELRILFNEYHRPTLIP